MYVNTNCLEKEMATHSSILAWRISWTDEPGEIQSMGHKELDMTEVTERAWKHRRPQIAKANLRKKNEAGGTNLPDFRTCYKYNTCSFSQHIFLLCCQVGLQFFLIVQNSILLYKSQFMCSTVGGIWLVFSLGLV